MWTRPDPAAPGRRIGKPHLLLTALLLVWILVLAVLPGTARTLAPEPGMALAQETLRHWPDGWTDGWNDGWKDWHWTDSASRSGSFLVFLLDGIGGVLHIVLLSLLCCLILLIAPQRIQFAAAAVRGEPWKAGLIGLLAFILFWTCLGLLAVVLIASCIGIVLLPLIALAALAAVVICLVGYTVAAYRLGHLLQERFDIRFGNPYLATIAGVVTIQIFTFFGGILAWGGWTLFLVSMMFFFFGFLVELWAWMVGLGGFLLSRPVTPASVDSP